MPIRFASIASCHPANTHRMLLNLVTFLSHDLADHQAIAVVAQLAVELALVGIV